MTDSDTLPTLPATARPARRHSLAAKARVYRSDVLGQSRLESKPSAESHNVSLWAKATELRRLRVGEKTTVYLPYNYYIQLVGILSVGFAQSFRLHQKGLTISVERIA